MSSQNIRVVLVDAKRGKLMSGWTYKLISADSEGIEVNADELSGWLQSWCSILKVEVRRRQLLRV